MEWVNITAKTLPEAIDLALDNLGVDEAEAEIEVLEEPKQGLFGRVRGNARVRARVKPRSTRPKVDRGRNRKRRSEGGRDGGSGGTRGRGRSRSGSGGKDQGASDGSADRQKSSAASGSADGGGDSRDGRGQDADGRSGGRDGNRGRKRNRDRGGRKSQDETGKVPVEEASMDEVSEQLETFLTGLTEAFGFEGGVTVSEDDGGLLASVDGRHGLMVGPKGRTLDAIQELTRVTAQRSAPSNIRIKVDVGGYRALRRDALVTFALEAAEEAKGDGKERSLEPMNSADRKVVHDALSDVDDVETRSAGTEPRRRVVVVPLAGASDEADDAIDDDTTDDAIDDTADGTADDTATATDDVAGEDVEPGPDADDDADAAEGEAAVDESESVGSQ